MLPLVRRPAPASPPPPSLEERKVAALEAISASLTDLLVEVRGARREARIATAAAKQLARRSRRSAPDSDPDL